MVITLQIDWTRLQTYVGVESLQHILWFTGIVVATLILKRPLSILITRISSGIARRFSDREHAQVFKGLILKPIEFLLQIILFYIALNQLSYFLRQIIFRRVHGRTLTEVRISDVSDKIFLFLFIIFLTFVLSRIIDFIFHVLIEKAYKEQSKEKEQLFPLIKEVVKIILWTFGAFWILGSVFNVNIPALITGLGIGGVAIALAAKESVENFFASFTILTDKPFETGDSVRLGTLEGKVERIGFRSTRLRNADGSLYIIPNNKLVNENLENLTQRDTRRVRIVFNLKYGLAPEELGKLISELKNMVHETLHVIEPVSVFVEAFGENALQLAMNYHLPEPMKEGANADTVKQEINFKAYKIIAAYTAVVPAEEEVKLLEDNPIAEEAEKKDDDPII
jgi:MscS family membrane protein